MKKSDINQVIKEKLMSLQEDTYATFQRRIVPNVNNIMGVRTPELRKIAKQIMKRNVFDYLDQASDETYEEILLQGMVIGYCPYSFTQMKPYIMRYITKINNWALCDLFVSGLKISNTYKEEMYQFIQLYLNSDSEYEIRFGVVMLLNYYMSEAYCEQSFISFDKITSKKYYVQMAVAWAISIYYVNYPEKTLAYLQHNQLDDFTYNKALQKIIESLKISKEDKVMIKTMKRKNKVH